jgi:hypothetical protein
MTLQNIPVVAFLIVATVMEVSGDALVRIALYGQSGFLRAGLFFGGAALLFGYGLFLNLAPVEFGKVAGLYIATLFVIWQIINYLFFKTMPTLPVICGGALIISGGLIVAYWRA